MERYVQQLLEDIAWSAENVSWPYVEKSLDLHDWISDEEEDRTAPVRQLEDWTGISRDQLPPHEKLTDDQVSRLLSALKEMLNAYNWCFVLQTRVPERIQYATICDNFSQEAKIKRWHTGFFELCRPGTEQGTCSLGEHCQCRFFEELFSGFSNEERTPEEERAMELECEIRHLKNKYGDEWMKYYPYHLDPEYDDEDGNPHDYGLGFGDNEDDEEDEDNWWRE